jgi:hypothetical protein
MGAFKIRPDSLSKLYHEKDPSKNLHDKKIIESLTERLNEKIQKDPKLAQKAALIIESWIKKK